MSKIRETAAPESLRLKEHDEILTRGLKVISGRIEEQTIKVKAKGLGVVSLDLTELRSMGNERGGIAITAGPPNDAIQWQDTGIDVESEGALVIRASGEIVHPLSFGLQLVTGPEGSNGKRLLTSITYDRFGAPLQGHFQLRPGTLVGKIGGRNDFFVVGSQFDAKVMTKGRLFLAVLPVQESERKPTGAYKVEAAADAKPGAGTKKLVPFNNEIEVGLVPFRDKRAKLISEVVDWRHALGSGMVNPKDYGTYEKAIQDNVKFIEELEDRVRTGFGNVLYPEAFLDSPSSKAARRIWR
jgi:hypothetical protein